MAERVDVLVCGSGFGGSITAFRLAELYHAAGADPRNIVVLERGQRYSHTEFRQSMDVEHLSDVYNLIQGQGAQVVVANAVGGGSNLYLAASLRAPTETFERRDRRPGDGPDRRMWPARISRRTLDPYYARAERGLRVNQPAWKDVSKSGGLWAATLAAAGYTCDRVPVAISPQRCVNANWCHTGCIFGAKNSMITNYLPSAERLGVQVRPQVEVESVRQSSARPYRYIVTDGAGNELECKVLVLATGAMGNAPILMRSRNDLPSLSEQVGRNLGVNGDHVAGIEFDPARVQRVLGLPRYADFYKGRPITTMTYDFWVGRRGNRFDGTRFTLQEIFLSTLTNFLYDDGRPPQGQHSGPRRRRRRRRGSRLRGPVLHRCLDRPDVAGRQPVADRLGVERALCREAGRARRRPRAAGAAGVVRAERPRRDHRAAGDPVRRLLVAVVLALAVALPAGAPHRPTRRGRGHPLRCGLPKAGVPP